VTHLIEHKVQLSEKELVKTQTLPSTIQDAVGCWQRSVFTMGKGISWTVLCFTLSTCEETWWYMQGVWVCACVLACVYVSF